MAKNIAVIGDSESIKGFGAIGIDIYPCDNNENAAHLLRNLADNDNYAVIYMTEELLSLLKRKETVMKTDLLLQSFPCPVSRATRESVQNDFQHLLNRQ